MPNLDNSNIFFSWFWNSLREDQKQDYRNDSLNGQLKQYCSYLEDHYSVKPKTTDIIQSLKQSDVDGETMEQIIEEVGLSQQILRQLVLKTTPEHLKELLMEKAELMKIFDEAKTSVNNTLENLD